MNRAIYYQGPILELPWSSSEGDDQGFNKTLIYFIAVFTFAALVLPLIPVPELAPEQQEKLPDNLARLLLEKQAVPEPVVEPPKPIQPPKEEPIPQEIMAPPPEPDLAEPKPDPEPKMEPPEPVAPAQLAEQARQRASVSGLLQFKDDLQEMRDMLDVQAVSMADLRRTEARAVEVKRDLLSSNLTAFSGGIKTDPVSVDAGGVALSGRANTQVDSSLSLPGGVGVETLYQDESANDSGRLPSRSEEEMRRIMDANKSAIFAIYNRALRVDPALQGKLMVKMTIDAAGFVTSTELVSSQLDNLDLEGKLLTRIKLIQFPAGDYALTTLNQTFDFLPF